MNVYIVTSNEAETGAGRIVELVFSIEEQAKVFVKDKNPLVWSYEEHEVINLVLVEQLRKHNISIEESVTASFETQIELLMSHATRQTERIQFLEAERQKYLESREQALLDTSGTPEESK